MESDEMHKFMHSEMMCIDVAKWYEGERIKRDPGQEFILQWIQTNAAMWRCRWNSSNCKDCLNWQNCGHYLLSSCQKYIKE
jgi:hypothetical protein